MARPKKYIIKLSDEEWATVRKTIRNKKTCKTVLKHCQKHQRQFQCCTAKSGRACRSAYYSDGLRSCLRRTFALDIPDAGRERPH